MQIIIFRLYGLAIIVTQKWKIKIYKLRKVGERIQVLQLTISRSKKPKKKKKDGGKDGFRPDSRLDWKIVEAY